MSPEFLLGYLDLAISGVLDYTRYAGLYLGPWWDLPAPAPNLRGWKRAVLKRRTEFGATHWGHLFLVCTEGAFGVDVSPVPDRWLATQSAEPTSQIAIRDGFPRAILMVRPSTSGRRDDLQLFLEDVAERFRRQTD